MIDLFISAVIIPLIMLLVSSSVVFELNTLTSEVSDQELMSAATSLADLLVNSPGGERAGLAESVNYTLFESKVFPNKVFRKNLTQESLGLPEGIGAVVSLGGEVLVKKEPLTGDAFSVMRWVVVDGTPSELRVTLYKGQAYSE